MLGYGRLDMAQGARLHSMTRHFVGAFHGVPGAGVPPPFGRARRQAGRASANVLCDAIAKISENRLLSSLQSCYYVASVSVCWLTVVNRGCLFPKPLVGVDSPQRELLTQSTWPEVM